MKKKLFTLALVALFTASASVGVFAQNPTDKEKSGNVENNTKREKRSVAPDPFAGLNISEAQRTKLDELNKRVASERKAEREAASAEKKARNRDQLKARAEAKKKYLEEVKSILGNDKYVTFLENFYLNGPRSGGKYHKVAQAHRSDRKKMNGDRRITRKDHPLSPLKIGARLGERRAPIFLFLYAEHRSDPIFVRCRDIDYQSFGSTSERHFAISEQFDSADFFLVQVGSGSERPDDNFLRLVGFRPFQSCRVEIFWSLGESDFFRRRIHI